MKRKKILVLSLTLVLAACAAAGSIAYDGLKSKPFLSGLKTQLAPSKKETSDPLVQVGDYTISKVDLENYKAIKKSAASMFGQQLTDHIDENLLLKEIVMEKVILAEAKKQQVTVSLEEGKQEAERLKQLLSQQPADVQAVQKQLIDTYGVSEEKYWNEIAPKQYQELLINQKLIKKWIENKILTQLTDTNQQETFSQTLEAHKEKLYQEALTDYVTVKDDRYSLK
ncbi:hypothetical protein [Paenibacillus lutrae]|uniref:Peptidylprolyl isomerase n=1 Tax=Paenibacillus lutrae TaxID=2078573 RepID=A0A7X3FH52_9BACL|nr:hypothetical protein [Paenibacillus lutrae]MVO99659.1 hypothetical protein [Paenibacillus lutrae]